MEIWKDISLRLILKDKDGIYAVYHSVDSNHQKLEIFSKKWGATEKECVEIEDCGTSAKLYWSFEKISCQACSFFFCYCCFGDKKKNSL